MPLPAWNLQVTDVEKLQGGDGAPFRDFVNRLLRAHGHSLGVPDAALATDSRNMRDGGVDAAMNCAAASDPCGRLTQKTCWQYKGQAKDGFGEAQLREAAAGTHVRELTSRGYAFRFCIADDLPAQKKQQWEKWIWDELKKHAPAVACPQILTSTDLKDWANRYPAVVLSVRPKPGTFQHLDHWGKNIVSQTPTYVQVPNWEPIGERLRQHVDFSKPVDSPVLRVHGDAGVGKTRFLYESLHALAGARELVLYTPEDQVAATLASYLIQEESLATVLVVDECSLAVRAQLDDNLRGYIDRVRVIVIDNSLQRPMRGAPEPELEKMPSEIVAAVLEANFPQVPTEARRAAADLSGGFIRLAADLCAFGFDVGSTRVSTYYDLRLPDEEKRRVVEAISLLTRVGFRDDVKSEFDELCRYLGMSDVATAKQIAKEFKGNPGFIAQGGRFFYVTPELIARIAFTRAWNRWAADDTKEFLDMFPPALYESFSERVSRSGTSNIREAVVQHAQRLGAELQPGDLGDQKKVLRFLALVETDPLAFLPRLRELIEALSSEQVATITGEYEAGDWGLRRKLVWLCERLAPFSEYFFDVERILWRLACYESEPGLGNNASAIWKQFFRIYLSGTAVPFSQRFSLLGDHLAESGVENADLILDAVADIFVNFASRTAGPAVVTGRIPPPDWQPSTQWELDACYNAALDLLRRAAIDPRTEVSTRAIKVWIRHTRQLLVTRRLELLSTVLRPSLIGEEQLSEIESEIDFFLHFDYEEKPESQKPPADYIERVRQWRARLVPGDFHSRLVSLVGPPEHHRSMVDKEEQWKEQIARLAREASQQPTLLKAELPWLFSPKAGSSFTFGEAIGALDSEAAWLDEVLSAASADALAFARGYLLGLAGAFPIHLREINQRLDGLESVEPKLTYHLSLTLPTQTAALARTIRLYDRGTLSPNYFLGFRYGPARQVLLPGALREVLPRLLLRWDDGDTQVGAIAVSLLYTWINDQRETGVPVPYGIDSDLRHDIGRVLAQTQNPAAVQAHEWRRVLDVYAKLEPENAVQLACVALENQNLALRDEATSFLVRMADATPTPVMTHLGLMLMDDARGIMLRILGINELLINLPTRVVLEWLEKTGLEGARRIASSLPRPFLDDGRPVLPSLTEAILQKFGDDEKIRRDFAVGSGIRSYTGDIAGQHDEEARLATHFLSHPLEAVRFWAKKEKASAEWMAARHRQEEAERFL